MPKRRWIAGLAALMAALVLLVAGLWFLRLWRTSDIGGGKATAGIRISSSSFSDGGEMPQRLSCDGADISPQIHFPEPPSGARSYLLMMEDIDAPLGFVHWIVYNLPADTGELTEGASPSKLPAGSARGTNSFGNTDYGGPCSPGSGPHRYVFRVYALDLGPELAPGLTKQQLAVALRGHILGEGQTMGLYARAGR